MEAKKLKHEILLRQWTERVKECQCSGKSIDGWCEENGIPRQTYYGWQRKVRAALCAEMSANKQPPVLSEALPEFAEITTPVKLQSSESPVVTLRIGRAICEIYSGADASIVEAALRAVTSKRC